MALPLEVLADLRLAVDGEAIDIRGEGDRLIVDLPSLRAGRRLLASGPFATGDRGRSLSRMHEALDISGITVDVRLSGDVIARIGKGARPSSVARLLNLGPVEVRPVQPLVNEARRRPLLVLAVIAGIVGLVTWLVVRARR
jgi:hypothetical protein